MDDKLLIDGLLIGEEMELTVTLTSGSAQGSRAWQTTVGPVTLRDSRQRPVAADWNAVQD